MGWEKDRVNAGLSSRWAFQKVGPEEEKEAEGRAGGFADAMPAVA